MVQYNLSSKQPDTPIWKRYCVRFFGNLFVRGKPELDGMIVVSLTQ